MHTDDTHAERKMIKKKVQTYEENAAAGTPPELSVEDIMDVFDYYSISGDERKASEVLDYAIRWYPASSLPYIEKANEALADGNIDEAIRYAGKVTDRDDYEYKYLEFTLLVAQGEMEEAKRYINECAKEVEESEDVDYDCMAIDIASTYIDYGYIMEGVEWLRTVKDKHSRDYREEYGKVMFSIGDYDKCIKACEKLIDDAPYCIYYWQMIAMAYYMAAKYDDALRASEYILAICPDDERGLYVKSNSLDKLGNKEEATKYYKKYCKVRRESGKDVF